MHIDSHIPDVYDGPLLNVNKLEVRFNTRDGDITVVSDATFTVNEGETVGIVGESGSGKSVTCFAVTGLLPKSAKIVNGDVTFGGKNLLTMDERHLRKVRGLDISMVFQEPMSSLNPAFTVGEQIAESVRLHWGFDRKKAKQRAAEMMDRVGIPAAGRRLDDYPHQFSGGMRQRVMIAMAIACEPKLLIADEPTTALDVTVQAQILDLLKELSTNMGMGLLLVTHDLGVVADACDNVVVMYAGEVVEKASTFDLFAHPQHPYSEGLLAATPSHDSLGDQVLSVIPGQPPQPSAWPEGCRFAPRCPYAEQICVQPGPLKMVEIENHLSRCRRTQELTLEGAK